MSAENYESLQDHEERIKALELQTFVSYFLFRPEITTGSVCHNAKTKLCEKCHEPECELAGWVKK